MNVFAPALLGMMGGIGLPELFIMLMVLVFAIGGTVFWIWMLIDCATKEADTGNDKVTWILVIAITHLIGAAIYFFVRRPQRIAQVGR